MSDGNGKAGRLVARRSAGENRVAAQLQEQLATLSAILGRASIASALGMSYGGDRDLYEALGYKVTPTITDYMALYRRQDVAKPVIDKPAEVCWRKTPTITESAKGETKFEVRWKDLVERLSLWSYFSRVDRLATLGQYAVLVIGFKDGKSLDQPVQGAKDVLYVMPYGEGNATIQTWDDDEKSSRFNLPLTYSVTIERSSGSGITKTVHWTRVIHVTQDNLESDTYGAPALEIIINNLQDLAKVSGGSAEMFWRGAFPGFGLKADADAEFKEGSTALAELKTDLEEYVHGLKRYLRLRGVSVEAMPQNLADPSNQVDVELTLIAAAKGMPKRILMGSERGELSSAQDEGAWMDSMDVRRRTFCEPAIIRQFITRCIVAGALPAPTAGYTCVWPDLRARSDKEVAETGETRARALKEYVDTPGADMLVAPEVFQEKMLGFTPEEIERNEAILGDLTRIANGDGDGGGPAADMGADGV